MAESQQLNSTRLGNMFMGDLVMDHKNELSELNARGIEAAVKNYIEKDNKEYVVDKAMEKVYNTLLERC